VTAVDLAMEISLSSAKPLVGISDPLRGFLLALVTVPSSAGQCQTGVLRMGNFPVLFLVDFLMGCFPTSSLPSAFVGSLPHGKPTCCNSFGTGGVSWLPPTDGEGLSARFFVAQCECTVGSPQLFEAAELLVAVEGRAVRGIETTKGLCFGCVSAPVTDDDVVLA
jgi:hypothetical protein